MASATDIDRFASLLQAACGVTRQRVSIIDQQATERAREAREAVGLTGETPISHPSADAIRAELGWIGEPIGVGELATWNYLWRDPVQAAVNGLMNSTPHRNVLVNPAFTHWGIGVYSELPVGETNPILARWYFIVWVATGVPRPKPIDLPVGLEPVQFELLNPPSLSSVVVGPNGAVNVRFSPRMPSDQIDFSTAATGPLRVLLLDDVVGEVWSGSDRWSALWIPDRGGFRYCHATLRSAAQPISL